MKHFVTARTAIAGLIALAAPFSPALADGKVAAPYLLADMMPKPGGMMDDKMGAMPSPAAPGAAAPAAGMAPAQQPGAPASAGMPGMMNDEMAMPPADAAASAMPGMQPPAPSAPPGGMPAQMMQMMQTMMQMPKTPGQPSAPLDHVEGRIAFIRAELGITDAQAPAWDAFAQALRSGRNHLAEARQALSASAGRQSNMASRLEAYEHHLSMRTDSMKAARESYQRLDPMLTAAQKQTAGELVAPLLLSF